MPPIIIIIVFILCACGAFGGLYIFFKLQNDWKKLDGEEIKVSAIFYADKLLVYNKNNLNSAVKLQSDKIMLKLIPFPPFSATIPYINVNNIGKVSQKERTLGIPGASGTFLEIFEKEKYGHYDIFAQGDSLEKLKAYFIEHQLSIL